MGDEVRVQDTRRMRLAFGSILIIAMSGYSACSSLALATVLGFVVNTLIRIRDRRASQGGDCPHDRSVYVLQSSRVRGGNMSIWRVGVRPC